MALQHSLSATSKPIPYAALNVLRVALYPRVSTEEQFLRGYSLQTQEEVLTQYAQDHGYKIVNVYRDEGHSARKPALKRKVMQDLLADVQAGKIDRILFIKLDRWFRNVREYHKIQEILEANNVTWQATMEDYNTATADGRLKVNIMLSVAENESDRTSERIKFVFDGKRRRKEWCFTGGPNQWPYGYKPQVIDGVKRCVKDPEKEPIVQDFWDYVVKYNSVRKAGMYVCEKYRITRNYRSWMVTAHNELYTGTFYGVEDYCPSYISRADWERIILRHDIIKNTQSPKRIYLFTGLIRCPECGNTMKATFKTYPSDRSIEYNGYRCNNSKLRTCSYRHQLSEKKVETFLLENIASMLEDYIVSPELQTREKRRQSQVQDVVALNEQLRRLNVIYMAGNMSDEDYAADTKRIKAQIEMVKNQATDNAPVNVDSIKAFIQSDWRSIYHSLPKEDQRRMWRSILEEIHVDGTSVVGVKPRA